MPRKGMLVNTLVAADGCDCSFHGVTSRYTKFVVTTTPEDSGRFHSASFRIFEPSDDAPELRLCVEKFGGGERICLRPVDKKTGEVINKGAMFSGNFVYTSDSRWPEIGGQHSPLPVHDRFEHDDTRRWIWKMYPGKESA